MTYAILDENNRCTSLVASEPSSGNWVKVKPGMEAAVGRIYNGWTFDAPRWTSYEFLNRFTPTERAAIRTGSMSDPVLADFLMMSQAAQEVVSDDPMTVMGMDYLVSVGVLTAQRKAEILS